MNKVRLVKVTPTIDTNIYASGDLLGDKMSFNVGAFDNGNLILDQVIITDLAKQSADVDLFLFDADPDSTTFTNNAAFDLDDADIGKVCAVISITGDHVLADSGVTRIGDLQTGIHIPVTEDTLYGVLVSRATPTYASVADLVVGLSLREA